MVRLLLSDQFNIVDGLPLIQLSTESLEEGGKLHSRVRWHRRSDAHKRSSNRLFGRDSDTIESSATLALVQGHTYGLLALGHPDPTHFQSNQDTLFLDHIGEALALILPRLLDKAK